jgi:hypothetical protein
MPIKTDTILDTNTQAFSDFVLDQNSTRLEFPTKPIPNFTQAASRYVGRQLSGSVEFPDIFLGERHYCQIIENRVVIGDFNILCPIRLTVALNANVHLYIADAVTDAKLRNQMIDLFNNYDTASGIELNDYWMQNNGGNITSKMFYVVPSCSLERVTEYPADITALERARDYYSGIGIFVNSEFTGGHDNYNPLRKVQFVDIKPPRREFPIHPISNDLIRERATTDPAQIIGAIKQELANGLASLDCGTIIKESISESVARVESWVEFQGEWIQIEVKGDCFTFHIPWYAVMKRESEKQLWFTVVTTDTNHLGTYVIDSLKHCAIQSALLSTVVGVVLWDFSAALAVFKESFADCIDKAFEDGVKCLTPDISVLTIVTKDWFRIF